MPVPPQAGPATPAASRGASASPAATATAVEGPAGPSWVIELRGFHYYNDLSDARRAIGSVHVRQTLIRNLMEGSVELPDGTFTMKELGIGFPIFVLNSTLSEDQVPNPYYQDDGQESGYGAGGIGAKQKPPKDKDKKAKDPNNVEYWPATRYDFVVQFVWQEKPLSIRREERRKKAEELAKANGGEATKPIMPPPVEAEPEPVAVEPDPMPVKPGPAEAEPMPPPDPADKPAPAPEPDEAAAPEAEGGK